jgi:hypothetical protein
MANTPFWSDASVQAALDAVKVLCNSGKLRIYSGAQPMDANAAATGTLLAEFTLAASAFGASSLSGTAPNRVATCTAAAISDVTASATNTAGYFRIYESNGTTAVVEGSVGTSGCDLNLTDVSLTSGETVHVTSLTLSAPE